MASREVAEYPCSVKSSSPRSIRARRVAAEYCCRRVGTRGTSLETAALLIRPSLGPAGRREVSHVTTGRLHTLGMTPYSEYVPTVCELSRAKEQSMTWNAFRSRGEILRDVTAVADDRRDGALPWDVAGVPAVFADELDLLGALQLRWHTRLAG